MGTDGGAGAAALAEALAVSLLVGPFVAALGVANRSPDVLAQGPQARNQPPRPLSLSDH